MDDHPLPAVIVLLNGPFGVGKTTVARILTKRIRNSMIFDPEEIGSALRAVLDPVQHVDDYQDYSLWRLLVVQTARLLEDQYRRDLLVPMTLWRKDYFNELVSGFRSVDSDVRCFRLLASESILHARIVGRPESEGPHEWALRHLASGVGNLRDSSFGVAIETDHRSPEQVADDVMAELDLRIGIDA